MSLTSDVRRKYIEIIDHILAKSDLTTISEKRIRKGLQDAVGYDLTPMKSTIKQLIMERFDRYAEQNGVGGSPDETAPSNDQRDGDSASAVPSPPPSTSPVKRQASSDATSEPASASPPAKKHKPDTDTDADAAFAAKLQAEENSRARPTRGGNTRRAAPVKKRSKAKTSKRVKAEDDSDVDSGEEPKKEVNRNTGFHKPMNLSEPLSALLGELTLSRPQTVKKVWQYIRENELQDPSDRRQILCDDAMRAVFKQDRVHMFTMTKILNQNLYSPDE
ncbi:hypothetical protein E8E15_000716 [Penicillium rubens]|uniref:uncharacterized protein n=1 Tax=Penicillium rubens TaxID=1108849 RepID=UPI001DB249E0|nr:uncharacterized protein N7525_004155 [Penicillium rubens]KAF3013103.1 hypothetical protein E8E15_000716 [Penicillium rubens]KAJ5045045.1 hypothetical protein NUH16_001857 [Penicillium rubens]KAJ5838967.1 hypothetical protein N7525_004155 [Penicillium rubens]